MDTNEKREEVRKIVDETISKDGTEDTPRNRQVFLCGMLAANKMEMGTGFERASWWSAIFAELLETDRAVILDFTRNI